jgi:hypothetical protein
MIPSTRLSTNKMQKEPHSSGILPSIDWQFCTDVSRILLVPPSRVKKSKKKAKLLGLLTLEDGIDRLSRNVGTEPPVNAA